QTSATTPRRVRFVPEADIGAVYSIFPISWLGVTPLGLAKSPPFIPNFRHRAGRDERGVYPRFRQGPRPSGGRQSALICLSTVFLKVLFVLDDDGDWLLA